MSNQIVLSACYLPPVSYFHAIYKHDLPILIDRYEHFAKQTYRTRTQIATANGILDLIVPIVHGRKEHVAMKDVRIQYEFDWQRLHWMSLQTAYRSSPFFEFYEDQFAVFYEKKFEFLFDFHMGQMELILKFLKIDLAISLSDYYVDADDEIMDFRKLIHPKKRPVFENPKPYYQVFEDRQGFIPNLSIVDLLFNQGPQSKNYL